MPSLLLTYVRIQRTVVGYGPNSDILVLEAVYAKESLPVQTIPSLPANSIGDGLDTDLEYVARRIGPAFVILPKGLENFFSRLEKLESAHRRNATMDETASAGSLLEDSTVQVESD